MRTKMTNKLLMYILNKVKNLHDQKIGIGYNPIEDTYFTTFSVIIPKEMIQNERNKI